MSVSERELEDTSYASALERLETSLEVGVWGEGRWGQAKWASEEDATRLEAALKIISAGSFPAQGKREQLTEGERRQLRDAMILCTHRRDRRDVFVTNDLRGFINGGRREQLERNLGVTIRTRTEFVKEHLG